ncbi:MAG: hypothetical protein IJK97_00630, partial [Thermoguttaceae bacterium]|nr:hypothetical protein [Thermoguttaceae bacterium]
GRRFQRRQVECGDTVAQATFTAFSCGNSASQRRLTRNHAGLSPRENPFSSPRLSTAKVKAANEAFGFRRRRWKRRPRKVSPPLAN